MQYRLVGDRSSIPPLPPRHVPRPRLTSALDRAADVPLTLISAGPGAGKTVLVTEWAAMTSSQLVWLSMSAVDVRPNRCWARLGEALSRAGAVSVGEAGRFSGPPTEAVPFAVKSMGALLDDPTDSVTLVIDDAHLITDTEVLAALDGLIRACSEGLRVVLLARSDPLLPLHRYRLAGLIREIRGVELAMTRDEIGDVLAAHGVSLSDPEVDLLQTRTEGWAAGVRLSAMRMDGHARPSEFVSELAVDQGSIGEYLLQEVLAAQSDDVRRMLVQTSFLDEVNGPLASAVTGIEGCSRILDELARSNSFVVPIDPAHTRFRYHQLFRDVLRYVRDRESGVDSSVLCRRAASWFEDHDDMSAAASWARRESDLDHFIDLLLHGALIHAFVNRRDIRGWWAPDAESSQLDAARGVLEPSVDAVLSRVLLALTADGEEAARNLDGAIRLDPVMTDAMLLASAELSELILAQKAGRPDLVLVSAARLLEWEPPASRLLPAGFRPAVLLAAAAAHFWVGREHDCAAAINDCLVEAAGRGCEDLESEAYAMLALTEAYWSHLQHSREAADRARGPFGMAGTDEPLALVLADSLCALVGADLIGTDKVLKQAYFKDVLGAEPGLEGMLTALQAALLLSCDEPVSAHELLQLARRYVAPPLVQTWFDMERSTVELKLERPRAALQVLEDYPTGYQLAVLNGDGSMAYLVEAARARALVALGEHREAGKCMNAMLTSTSPLIGRYQVVEGLMCSAQVAWAGDDEGRALEMLTRALQVANGDIRLPVVTRTAQFTGLLKRHPSLAAEWPVPLAADVDEADRVPAHPRPRSASVVLTERERAVLRYLATGMATAEIAAELCVSVNTVKTHLAAIYRKLPARRRREAVFRARELELL